MTTLYIVNKGGSEPIKHIIVDLQASVDVAFKPSKKDQVQGGSTAPGLTIPGGKVISEVRIKFNTAGGRDRSVKYPLDINTGRIAPRTNIYFYVHSDSLQGDLKESVLGEFD